MFYYPITIEAPYLYVIKSEILAEGLKLGVDYSLTWTCYKGGQKACGKCGSCVERLEAFQKNKIKDPLPYES
jgi:7-cyano-7-deazaguanine synthase